MPDTRRGSAAPSGDCPAQLPPRLRLRGRRGRTDPSLLPTPKPGYWGVLTLFLWAVLVQLLVEVGAGKSTPDAFDRFPLSWLFRFCAGLAEVLTTGAGAGLPTRLAALFLAIATCWAGHGWRRAWLAAAPGAVAVRDLVDGTGDVRDPVDGTAGLRPPRAELQALLRRQLSETRLYPTTGEAGKQASRDFLDVLAVAPPLQAGWVGTIMGMVNWFSRAWPRAAYEVTATVVARDAEPRCGMVVTVTSLAQGKRSAMTTVWARSWEDATNEAGYWVLATILPVTKLAGLPPWRAWRGRNLPVELFRAYDEGQQAQRSRHFDLALWSYAEALRCDPLNLELRLLVAGLLEELGLSLEALDIYHSALTCEQAQPCAETVSLPALLNWVNHLLPWLRNKFRCRWDRRPDLRLRYRYVSILATSESSGWEWFVNDAVGDRDKLRAQMRERLGAAFRRDYVALATPFSKRPRDWLARMLDGTWSKQHLAVEAVFRVAALAEIEKLRRDLTVRWPWWLRWRSFGPRRATLTGRSLQIAVEVWAPLRVAAALASWRGRNWAESDLPVIEIGRSEPDPTECAPPPEQQEAVRCVQKLIDEGWFLDGPDFRWVEGELDRAFGSRVGLLVCPMSFADHYMAACVYSLVLCWSLPDDEAGTVARRAVEHLRAALATQEAPIAGHLRDWLLSGDRDLDQLRRRPEFAHFERDLFPRPELVPPRSSQMLQVCSRAYARDMISQAADLLEQQWHRNGEYGGDVHDLRRWLKSDVELWRVLRRIAADRAWYWKDRAQFICLVTTTVDQPAVLAAQFPPPFPRFEEVELPGEEKLVGLREWQAECAELLARLHRWIEDAVLRAEVEPQAGAAAGEAALTRAGAELLDQRGGQLSAEELTALCEARAAQWQQVAAQIRMVPMHVARPPRADDPNPT
ncbi:hypothetical protein AB0L22_21190 [Micromonospora haikouensis]|uniref:hypothetical protein n=1 Tax=Micromonospora haikouensis TaxID=686309 RepID=UPI00343FBD85